jgi:hypothetical protein
MLEEVTKALHPGARATQSCTFFSVSKFHIKYLVFSERGCWDVEVVGRKEHLHPAKHLSLPISFTSIVGSSTFRLLLLLFYVI